MANTSSAGRIVIPQLSANPPAERSYPAVGKDTVARLVEIASLISSGAPAAEVIERILVGVSELYGLTDFVFEVRAQDIRSFLQYAICGYPEDKATKIMDLLSSEFYPKGLVPKTFQDKYKVSRHGYLILAEEWRKLTAGEPCSDHPAYYKFPEQADAPRKGPDYFHDSDFYRYAVQSSSGELLAYLDIGYSHDHKFPPKEVVEAIDAFIDMTGLALETERLRLGAGLESPRAIQKTMLLEDVLKIASSITSERDLKKLSNMILASVSSLFGFGKVSLVVHDEAEGVFKWMAVFGYPEELVKDTKERSIPTEVILNDLKENHRIGKSAYFTPAEELSTKQLAYNVTPMRPESVTALPPRRKDEQRPLDVLAFALHDSTGRIVGVIYPSAPRDSKLPDRDTIETIEVLTSLAEVAVENARLAEEREQALRASGQRTEQLSRILDLASGIMYVRNLDQMLDDLLKTLARLMGIKRMVIGIKHPDEGVYKTEAVYGYSPKAVEGIKRVHYALDQVDGIVDTGPFPAKATSVKWRKKVGRMTYYMPVEAQGSMVTPEESPYYPDIELIRMPRAGKDRWHELDWMDTLILDRSGLPIAYLEVLKPRDDRIPDADTIEVIEIFASLAGIAIENSRMLQEHIDSRRDAELYTDVLSHDIKNFNQAILGYLDLLRAKLDKPDLAPLIDKVGDQVMNTSWLASNVRTMSRVTFGDVELKRVDLGSVLLQCEKNMSQYYPTRKVVINHSIEAEVCYTEADDLIWELLVNILTNAAKYDTHEPLELDMSIERTFKEGVKRWVVSIADRGRGVPDEMKSLIFDRFSKASKKQGSGMGLHIVKTLAKRYHGSVWVEDRVQGNHSLGAMFKVELPAVD